MATANKMGTIAIAITVTNLVDEILAERSFIPNEQVRSSVNFPITEFLPILTLGHLM